MNKPRILSCGEMLWDLFPEGARFGGAPANFACHVAIRGGEVSMLSAVGHDARGEQAVRILQGFGMDSALVQRIANAPTGSVSVTLDAAGKPSFAIHAGSAWDHMAWSPELEACTMASNAIYFGTLGQRGEVSRATIRRALRLAKAHGSMRVLDVNLRRPFYDAPLIRESIALANIVKLSDDELPEVADACGISWEAESEQPGLHRRSTETAAEATLEALRGRCGLDVVVMTRGAKGALLVSADGVIDQPGIPTTVVDTVGAGDSFTAAFILGLLRGEPHQDILRKACETASAVCAQSGAVPTLIESGPSTSLS